MSSLRSPSIAIARFPRRPRHQKNILYQLKVTKEKKKKFPVNPLPYSTLYYCAPPTPNFMSVLVDHKVHSTTQVAILFFLFLSFHSEPGRKGLVYGGGKK